MKKFPLKRQQVLPGLSMMLSDEWIIKTESDAKWGPASKLIFSSHQIIAELEIFSIKDFDIEAVLETVKFNYIELIHKSGVEILPHDQKRQNEILAQDYDRKTFIVHMFSRSAPMLHLSARGAREEDLNELRYMFQSIVMSEDLFSKNAKSEAFDLLSFDIAEPHWNLVSSSQP